MMQKFNYLVWFILLTAVSSSLQAATITIVNADGSGEGFNDTTAFTPVGGNHAVTVGQARLNALQYAANIVGQRIVSNITIRINAKMDNQGGTLSSATLATAGPTSTVSDFGAGTASTWYPVALAEALKGAEINSSYDINFTGNSDIDNDTVLGTKSWYYGLDGNAGTDTDFVTVAIHEILHGLGFITVMNSDGSMPSNRVDVYLNNLEHHGATPADFPSMNDTQRQTATTATSNLHWTGAQVAANSGSLSAGKSGTHVYMYAPGTYSSGSSVNHFSDSVTPNELMEPFYTSVDHTPGLAISVLQDIGWTTKTGSGSADLHLALSNSGVVATQNSTYTLTVTNNGANTAVETTVTYMIPTGHSYVSSNPAQGSCSQANQLMSCSLGDLASSASTTVGLVVVPASTATATHGAIVSSATSEANASDNRVSDEVSPTAAPATDDDQCFIATAAYGSRLEKNVVSLRRFRDDYLLTNRPGRAFVRVYYQTSPPVADLIRSHDFFRSLMRGSLGPLVVLSRWITGEKAVDLQHN